MTGRTLLRCSPALGRRRRVRGERGAVLVEVVLIVPLLLVISLGVFDIGLGWKTSLTITNAARAGARVASNLGVSSSADKSTLAAISASMGSIPQAEIERVIIYKATSANGMPPTACITMTPGTGDATNLCNVYTGAELNAASTSTLYTGNCASSRDRFYCPTNRNNTQGSTNGPDYVGIYIAVNHGTKTKVFGSTMGIKERSIMRIEPNAGS